MQQHSKSKVCYYYDSDIGNYYYGQVDRKWFQFLQSPHKIFPRVTP